MAAQWVDIPLGTQAGEMQSAFSSAATLWNMCLLPTPPGSGVPFVLAHTQSIGSRLSAGSGFVRGVIAHGDYLWFVRGTELYRLSSANVGTLVGTIAGTALVRMVGTGLNEIVIVDGSNYYKATTSAVTAIVPPAGAWCDVTSLDGFTVYVRTGTDKFDASDLDDPTTVGALSFSTADGVPDVLVGCETSHRELILFGKKHVEFWYNAGGASFPFARTSPGVIDRGCAAARSIAKYNETVFFLGDDMSVYRLDGYRPVRISTDWVDRSIRVGTVTEAQVGAGVYVDANTGRAYYELSLGYDKTSETAYSYDIGTGLWHIKSHNGLSDPRFVGYANFAMTSGGSFAPATFAAVNTATDGGVHRLTSVTQYRDVDAGSTDTVRYIVCPAMEFGGKRFAVHEVRLSAAQNAGTVYLATTRGTDLSYQAFSTINMAADPIRWTRLGMSTRMTFTFAMSANALFAVSGARALVEVMDT